MSIEMVSVLLLEVVTFTLSWRAPLRKMQGLLAPITDQFPIFFGKGGGVGAIGGGVVVVRLVVVVSGDEVVVVVVRL